MGGAFPSLKFPSCYLINTVGTGDFDLYTVPASRKAMVIDFIITNPTAGSIAYFPELKLSGTYYRIGQTKSEGTLGIGHNYGMSNSLNSQPIILNAGESIALNIDTAGLTVWAQVLEFDASSPFKRASITSWSAGDNILYTCPVNKTVSIGQPALGVQNNPTASMNGICYENGSVGTRTLGGIYIIPNGSSKSSSNQFAGSNSIISGQGFSKYFPGCINPGDTIVLNTDSNAAGQIAWINYQEANA